MKLIQQTTGKISIEPTLYEAGSLLQHLGGYINYD